jgi:hypothetical protein
MKKTEMGRACNTYGRENRYVQGFGGKPGKRIPLEHGRVKLKWIFEKWNRAWTDSIWLRTGTGGGLL